MELYICKIKVPPGTEESVHETPGSQAKYTHRALQNHQGMSEIRAKTQNTHTLKV